MKRKSYHFLYNCIAHTPLQALPVDGLRYILPRELDGIAIVTVVVVDVVSLLAYLVQSISGDVPVKIHRVGGTLGKRNTCPRRKKKQLRSCTLSTKAETSRIAQFRCSVAAKVSSSLRPCQKWPFYLMIPGKISFRFPRHPGWKGESVTNWTVSRSQNAHRKGNLTSINLQRVFGPRVSRGVLGVSRVISSKPSTPRSYGAGCWAREFT